MIWNWCPRLWYKMLKLTLYKGKVKKAMKACKIRIGYIEAKRSNWSSLLMMKTKLQMKIVIIDQNQVYPSTLTPKSKRKFNLPRNMLTGDKTIIILICRRLYRHLKIVKVRYKTNKRSEASCSWKENRR